MRSLHTRRRTLEASGFLGALEAFTPFDCPGDDALLLCSQVGGEGLFLGRALLAVFLATAQFGLFAPAAWFSDCRRGWDCWILWT